MLPHTGSSATPAPGRRCAARRRARIRPGTPRSRRRDRDPGAPARAGRRPFRGVTFETARWDTRLVPQMSVADAGGHADDALLAAVAASLGRRLGEITQ